MKYLAAPIAALAVILSACGEGGAPIDQVSDQADHGRDGAAPSQGETYTRIADLISDVEGSGFTCWRWQIDDDEVSPSLLGAAASASCYRDADEMGVYYSVGRIAIFASTAARDDSVQRGFDNGTTHQFVGANYVVDADEKSQLDKLVGAIDGEIVGNEFAIEE